MRPPDRLPETGSLATLKRAFNRLRDYAISTHSLPGIDMRVGHTTQGTTHQPISRRKSAAAANDRPFRYRGAWEDTADYEKGDAVEYGEFSFTSGSTPERDPPYEYVHYGLFIAIADNINVKPLHHVAGSQQAGNVISTGPTDVWRRMAQGWWNDLRIGGKHTESAGIDTIEPLVRLGTGTIACTSGLQFDSQGQQIGTTSTATLSPGSIAAGSGLSAFVFDVGDIGGRTDMKFRLTDVCVNTVVKKAYVARTDFF